PARRARPGRHDHAPSTDRQPRRAPLQRREDSRRSDAHAYRAPRRGAPPRGDRAHARRPRVPLLAPVRVTAQRELLAARRDVWKFIEEPYHMTDWWPGLTGVQPDHRGMA